MPVSALPHFDITAAQEQGAHTATEAQKEQKEEAARQDASPRHAWLRTHLMPEAPLLHPSASAKYEAPQEEEREKRGWQMWKGSMVSLGPAALEAAASTPGKCADPRAASPIIADDRR